MGSSTPQSWTEAGRPERRQRPDRRVPPVINCQESLARIVAETRGNDSLAGRALAELARRKSAAQQPAATPDDELVIYSLRGRWLVGTVAEIREAVVQAAAAACRRARGETAPEGTTGLDVATPR